MSIRAKTFLLITAPFLILLIILFRTSSVLINRNSEQQEKNYIATEMNALQIAVDNSLSDLAALTQELAGSEDLDAFFVSNNTDMAQEDIQLPVFVTHHLNYIIRTDQTGLVLYGSGYNLTDNMFVPIPQEINEYTFDNSPVLPQAEDETVSGILQTNSGPLLFAAHSIRADGREAAAGDVLILAKRLTLENLTHLSNQLQLPLRLSEYDTFTLPEDAQFIRGTHGKTSSYYRQDQELITSYTILSDIFGEPAVVLTTTLPRLFYNTGVNTFRTLTIVVTSAVFALCVIVYFILDKTLLSKILQLVANVRKVAQEEASTASGEDKDELTAFSGNLDQILTQLELSQSLFTVSKHMQDLVAVTDLEGKLTYVSPSHKTVLGYRPEELNRQDGTFFFHPDDVKHIQLANTDLIQNRKAKRLELRFRHADGHYIWVETLPALICNEHDEPESILVCSRDITARKQMEEQLRYHSLFDVLTGLYNRNFFEEEMRRLHKSRNSTVGIILCDVDGLKIINDGLGHDAGDTLLKSAAVILKSCFREGDIVARIGGDEFAVLLPYSTQELIEEAYRRIRSAIDQYNDENSTVYLSISIGYAVGHKDIDIKDVFKQADNQMYREKLHQNMSTRSATVQLLMKALEARDYITEGHAERLLGLVELFAAALDLPEHRVADLRLLARFHDIGKVGIPDKILFKDS